jgi:phosphoglycolate phosphatase
MIEAGLLGVAQYFGRHIYGARDGDLNFDKELVIREYIIKGCNVDGASLVGFGDGFVEIQNALDVGGLAVAVLSDENLPTSGNMDAAKRAKLEPLKPQIMLSDYRKIDTLVALLF